MKYSTLDIFREWPITHEILTWNTSTVVYFQSVPQVYYCVEIVILGVCVVRVRITVHTTLYSTGKLAMLWIPLVHVEHSMLKYCKWNAYAVI